MKVTLAGIGCAQSQLTAECREAIQQAGLIIGAKRMLEALPEHTAETADAYLPEEILHILQNTGAQRVCIVFSGDTGFYSGVRTVLPLLEENKIEAAVLPGISSVQTMSARVGLPWQGWRLRSAHGQNCDPLREIMSGQPCFFLTGGSTTPAEICSTLREAGLGGLKVWVGENLCYPDEKITCGTAEEFSFREFSPLSVLLTEAAPVRPACVPGIADDEFLREKIPMTKREVRAAALAALRITPEDICWDVGAGTGSVSVEMALHSAGVWALERKPEAVELVRRNREKFCAWNLRLLQGTAPEDLNTFPVPDAVFIGGSGGHLREIINCVVKRNPKVRICVSALALETLSAANAALQELDMMVSVTQIAVSRTKPVGELSLLIAQNPVFLITGAAE